MRAFTQEEWDALIAAYPPGTPVSGEVIHRATFGVFVRLDQLPEVTALLEIIHFGLRAADPDHRIQFPADYPANGTRVEARVLAWCATPKDVRLTQLPHPDWVHSRWLAEQRHAGPDGV